MVDIKYTHRLVHFDLKGATPRINYLEKVIPLISSWGATGILLEYEDSFPFENSLSVLKKPSSYTVKEVHQIIALCKFHNLEIIPLVQTFGHLEFVLKHDEFRHFREVDLYPNALCPMHPKSVDLVISLVDSIMQLHQDCSYLHIGADEVWHLGKCRKCQSEMDSRGWTLDELFLNWVTKVGKFVKEKYPRVKLMMWDDMMRTYSVNKLKEFEVGDLFEPMIWKYEASNFNLPDGMFDNYSKVFDRIWVAGCFKGATGSTQFLPPIQHHIDNQLTWLTILKEHQSKFKEICGFVLTGWQRYDHYSVLCELLPVAVPSLALCLRVLKRGAFILEDHEAVSKELGFQTRVNVFPFPRPQILEQGMVFPGHEIYIAVQMWSNFVHKYQMICNSEGMLGWFSDYFRSRNFTNPAQVEMILVQLIELEGNLEELRIYMEQHLMAIFCEDTVEEWIGCFFKPLQNRVEGIIRDCKFQIKVGGRTLDYNVNKLDIDQS